MVNAGSNVDMRKWQDRAPALVYLWYPGQEGGRAAAEILFGKVNPSGKLPVSFERQWEDNPAFNWYYDDDSDKRVTYGEKLNIGYRGYDASGIKPNFAFGYGMSYTDFEFSNLKVKNNTKNGKRVVTVALDIKNTGDIDGKEVAQIYVHPISPKVERPYKELKGFEKKMVKAGEKVHVEILLDDEAFSYYDPSTEGFIVDKGKYEILVGNSSDNLPLRQTISLK